MKKSGSDPKIRGRPNQKLGNKPGKVASPYSRPTSKPRSSSASKIELKPGKVQNFESTHKALFQEPDPAPINKKSFLRLAYSQSQFDSTRSEENIEKKLLNDIRNVKTPDQEFEIYQKYFADIIKLDKTFGKVLLKIKSGYDCKIANTENGLVNTLKNEIRGFQSLINKENKEKKLIMKKLEKLAKENVELSRALDETEEKCNVLGKRFHEISRFDVKEISKDEATWKALAYENKALAKRNKEMQVDLKNFVMKEKRLVSLIMVLKEKGYPVEEIYEKQVLKKKKPISPGSYVEDTDNEALVSERLKLVKKPAIIPKLNLDDVQPDIASNDSFCLENAY